MSTTCAMCADTGHRWVTVFNLGDGRGLLDLARCPNACRVDNSQDAAHRLDRMLDTYQVGAPEAKGIQP